MKSILIRFMRDESGATAIEYGLIAALLSVAIIASLRAAGISVRGLFDDLATALAGI
jgi:pilus assembly protein Flp/PilA